jgi:DNA-binding GntR family transcriptional regulator
MIRLTKRSNLAEQITGRLFEAILQGELKPGERIIETKMASQLGVGQSTFREALQALEHRGLVTKDHGTFVTKLTPQDVELLFTVRLALEPLAASMACGKLTPTQIGQLELFLDEMKRARQRRDFPTLLRNDLAFHELIWEAPQVGTLKRILNLVLPPLFAFFFMRHAHAFSNDPALAEETFRKEHEDHCRLLAALKKGKPEEAKQTFQEVNQQFLQTILELRAEAGAVRLPPTDPASGETPAEVEGPPPEH